MLKRNYQKIMRRSVMTKGRKIIRFPKTDHSESAYLNFFIFQLSSVILALALLEYEIKFQNPFALVLLQSFSVALTLACFSLEVFNDYRGFVKEHRINVNSRVSFKEFVQKRNLPRFFFAFLCFNIHNFSP